MSDRTHRAPHEPRPPRTRGLWIGLAAVTNAVFVGVLLVELLARLVLTEWSVHRAALGSRVNHARLLRA